MLPGHLHITVLNPFNIFFHYLIVMLHFVHSQGYLSVVSLCVHYIALHTQALNICDSKHDNTDHN